MMSNRSAGHWFNEPAAAIARRPAGRYGACGEHQRMMLRIKQATIDQLFKPNECAIWCEAYITISNDFTFGAF